MGTPLTKTISGAVESLFDRLWSLAQRWWVALVVIMGGLVVGSQVASTNKRIVQVIAAGVIVIGAIRLQSLTGLLVLIPLLPFPKYTTYGGTTFAFVLFVFLIWLAKLTLRIEHTQGKSPIDFPVGLLIFAYVISFSQIDSTEYLYLSLQNFFLAMIYIAIGYLVIHLVRTEDDLKKVLASITVMAVLVQFTAVFELFFPGRPLIPGWITLSAGRFTEYIKEGLEITGVRVGGAFQDYELLAEFCAMIVILQWFFLMQSRTLRARLLSVSLVSLSTFVLFATVTRGAIVALAIASAYLLWIARRHIRFHTLVVVALAVTLGGATILLVVSQQTKSGNIIERFSGTEFKSGVPDTRQQVWSDAWERVWESPLVGHGPYYSFRAGVRKFFWPHNNYLFYWHMIGIFGLLAFLFVLYRLWRATRFRSTSMADLSFSRSLLLAQQGMLILFVIDQIKIDYIRNNIYPFWVWLFFGLIIATSRIAQTQTDEENATPLVELVETKRPGVRAVSSRPAVTERSTDVQL